MSATIVVGVDGSEGADRALAWAVAEAELRGAKVQAVHVWTYPYIADVAYLASGARDREDFATAAKQTVADALARLPEPLSVAVESVVLEGPTAPRLWELAADADLLVVGSRGHGGFSGLLLGSVSQQCVAHARCPVVVIPHR